MTRVLRINQLLIAFLFLIVTMLLDSVIPFSLLRQWRRADTPLSASTQSDDADGGGGVSIGFIGCGTIASAIATGMATQKEVNIDSMIVTRRSEAKSKLLQETFPDLVTVQDDNQKIVDQCQLIFLTVLPQQTKEVLESLTFQPGQSLVSLVSTASLPDLVQDSGLVDESQVSKMICLPSVARHQGVCLHCFCDKEHATTPSNALLTQLFTAMGGVVTLDNEKDLSACMMTTCTMGPIYGMMKQSRDWLLQSTSGLSKEEASFLVIKQCVGAILDTDREDADGTSATDANRLEKLIEEQTPGGLNEQALSNCVKLGGLDGQDRVMNAIVSRIRGESDGSV